MTSSPGTIQGYWLSDFDVESLGSLLPRLAIKHEIEQLKMKRSDYCIEMCMVFVFHFSMSLYLLVLSCVIRFPSLAPILSLIISIFPFLITSYSVIFFILLNLTLDSLNIKLSLLPGLPGPAGKQQETAS